MSVSQMKKIKKTTDPNFDLSKEKVKLFGSSKIGEFPFFNTFFQCMTQMLSYSLIYCDS